MQYQYLSDCHTHTDCSSDASDPAMMMCETAARMEIYALAITDHCECNLYYKEDYDRSIRQSYFEAKKAASVFRDSLHVYAGIELGQPMQNTAAAEDALSSCQFDFVLASLHNVKDMEDFYSLDCRKVSVDNVLERYFDELLETIAWGNFDSLAHLTYPWRYIVGEQNYPLDGRRYEKRIDEVLTALISHEKALEINTSGLRQKLGETMPNLQVLRRYRELGGELVTIGSDAHCFGDLCAGVETGMTLLREAGFSRFTVYEQRNPMFLPIA